MQELKKAITPLIILFFGVCSIIFGVLAIEITDVKAVVLYQKIWFFLLIFFITALCGLTFLFFSFGKEKTYKLLLLSLGFVFLSFLSFYGYERLKQTVNFTSVEDLRAFIAAKGSAAVWLYIALQFAQVTFIPIPSTITTGVGYALFGLWKGTLYAFIGSMLGSVLAFGIGRVCGYRAAKWIVGQETLDGWLNKVKGKDKLLLTFMFVMPLFPDDILCLVAGLSTMSTSYFVGIMIPVRLVTIFVTCLTLGGKLIPFRSWGIVIWGILLLVLIAVTFFCWKKGTKMQEVLLKWVKKGKRDDK